jgi:hypothetical protein
MVGGRLGWRGRLIGRKRFLFHRRTYKEHLRSCQASCRRHAMR